MDLAIPPSTLQRRKRLLLLGGGAALALACAAVWAINRAVAPSVPAAELLIAEIKRGSIADTINASGLVVPVHEELLPSPVQSRVAKVHARPGQQVKTGELLLELDSRLVKLEAERLKEQLAQQENRVLALSLELEQKRKQLSSAIELLELDLQSARAKLQRSQMLRKAGGISAEDMLTAELNVQRIDIQLRQHREQIEDSKRSTRSSIDGAQLQKNILGKQLAQQEQLLAQTQVRAPFDGMLTWLAQEEGAAVGVGQLVAKVSELHNYRVEASLSDYHARSVEAGQKVQVEQGSLLLTGQVHTILPEIQNGTVKLLVTLDQPHHSLLRNKLRVDVNIVASRRDGVLVAQRGPAINGKGRQAVFVIRDGVARKTELDIGASDGKAVEISGGAQAGERLIVSDISRYKEYASFRVTH
ncbi:efflux RND transporter periplasmic adaptor subunit [Massilia sp. NR 4-1]|uniref:efflux RND transporter periplasmic adaptor subunit n=1 Tax=Massilia sp. NR 4-1 TaxID=1678028 RepID=UPI00067DC5AD|nr:HlyD family efflux transporter periplasmic adaptor subunit [Massilia sp. NR 4-1]AKU21927.1 ABC transporter permease [Massilia sp. NR 4-1]